MYKKFLPSFLIILFSFSAFTRVEGANEIKSVLFVTIFMIGLGFGLLIKNVINLIRDKKRSKKA